MQVLAIKADVSLDKKKPQDLRRTLGSFSMWENQAKALTYMQETNSLHNMINLMQQKLK